jgi:hypothetical protein
VSQEFLHDLAMYAAAGQMGGRGVSEGRGSGRAGGCVIKRSTKPLGTPCSVDWSADRCREDEIGDPAAVAAARAAGQAAAVAHMAAHARGAAAYAAKTVGLAAPNDSTALADEVWWQQSHISPARSRCPAAVTAPNTLHERNHVDVTGDAGLGHFDLRSHRWGLVRQ